MSPTTTAPRWGRPGSSRACARSWPPGPPKSPCGSRTRETSSHWRTISRPRNVRSSCTVGSSAISSSSAPPLDVAAVRDRFPALASGAAYLDGPGGSQCPREVLDTVATYMERSNANLGGAFPTSADSDEVMARGRGAAADFTGTEPAGIAFGANMTTLNFLLAHAVARTLRPGDEIVVTQLDHDANISPWLLVAADHDLVVRHAPIRTDDVTLDHDALEGMIGERTRVVAFTLASNAVGSITDPARIAAAAHAAGALAWADGVHLAPHRRLRAREWGLDVLLCSPYKFFGPHWGIAAAIDYLRSLGEGSLHLAFERIQAHEDALARRFLDGLPDGVELYGIG